LRAGRQRRQGTRRDRGLPAGAAGRRAPGVRRGHREEPGRMGPDLQQARARPGRAIAVRRDHARNEGQGPVRPEDPVRAGRRRPPGLPGTADQGSAGLLHDLRPGRGRGRFGRGGGRRSRVNLAIREHRLAPLVTVTAAALVFAILLIAVRLQWAPLESADHGAAAHLNTLVAGHARLVSVVKAVTWLGSTGVLWVVIAVSVGILATRKRWRLAIYLVVTGAGA